MRLDPFKYPADVSVAIRDELYVVAAILATVSSAAGSNFRGKEEQSAALVYAAEAKVEEILKAIQEALALDDAEHAGVAA